MKPAARVSFRRTAQTVQRQLLAAEVKELLVLGLYAPAAPPPPKAAAFAEWLTPWRMRQIRSKSRAVERLQKDSVFAPFPKSNGKTRKAIASAARAIGAKPTATGVFVPREDRELRQPTGKLAFDRQSGLWVVKVKKTFTDRQGVKHTHTEDRYLAGADALEAASAKLDNKFRKLHLGPHQRVRFLIQGRNISRHSFTSMASMLEYARRYRKDPRAQATFLNSLTVMVFEKTKRGNYEKPVAWINKRGSRVEVSPDILGGYFDTIKGRKKKRSRRV